MNPFKNRILSKVNLLTVFTSIVSGAFAAETLSLSMELDNNCYPHSSTADLTMSLGSSSFTVGYGQEGSSSVILDKGASYDLGVTFDGGLYPSSPIMYIGTLTGVATPADAGFILSTAATTMLGNVQYSEGDTDDKTGKVHVPLVTTNAVVGAIPYGSDYVAISNVVEITLKCVPEEISEQVKALVIWEGGTAVDGFTRTVTLSETNSSEEVIATYAGEEIFHATIEDFYGAGYSGNIDLEKINEFEKKRQNTTEPIDTRTGNNHFSEKRLYVPAPNLPLVLDLKYQSVTSQPEGMIGKGWRHSFEWSLDTSAATPVVYTGAGEKFTFGKKSDGTFIPSLANNWTLQTNGTGHVLSLTAGLNYTFNSSGQLTSIVNAWGNSALCAYGANDCLESVTHSNGQQMSFSNEWVSAISDWRVATIEVVNGASLSFSYNGDGQFTQVVEQVGTDFHTSTYQYEDGFLTNKVNGAGFEYQFEYAPGTGKGTHLAVDRYYAHDVDYVDEDTTQVSYEARGLTQYHRYSYGARGTLDTKYGPAETSANVTARGISYTYDPSGTDITEETVFDSAEAASWAQFKQYDSAHNITNYSVAYGGAAPTQQFSMEYDPVWNLPAAVVDADGSRTETVYTNGVPRVTKAFYSDTQSHDTHYSYSTNGWLRAVTNANQHAVAYGYDAAGNLTTVTPQVGPIVTNTYDALGFLKTTEFYVEESMFVSRRITEYERDAKGRVDEITYPDGLTSSYKYNALGYVTNSVDRAERVTDYTYAPTKKFTSVTRYLEDGGSKVPVRISYDLDEQVNVLSITEPRGRFVESYKMDVQDRITSVTNIENQVMDIDYGVGDFVKGITRFDGSTVSNTYDQAGRLSCVEYSRASVPLASVSRDYHADSQLKSISDDVSTNGYAYNLLNQLTNASTQVSGFTSQASYEYDPVGNITNSTVSFGAASPVSSSYAYDAAERLEQIASGPSTLDPQTFDYSYNPRNGQIASVVNTNSGIRCSYGYDLMERVDSITYRKANGALIRSIDYAYDAASMITNKIVAGESSSISTGYQYDSIDRLTSETRTAGGTSSTSSYAYDLAGNRLSKTSGSTVVNYSLGTGNRLASWSAPATNTLVVDVRGISSEPIGTDNRWGTLSVSNLTAQVGTKPQVDGSNFIANNLPMNAGTNTYVAAIRDEAGNMGYATNTVVYSVVTNGIFEHNSAGCITNIAHTGTAGYSDSLELDWDERYRLISVDVIAPADSNLSSFVAYEYDVLDRKISRAAGVSPAIVERYVYDGQQVAADLDGSGNLLRSYVWGAGVDNLMSFTDHTTSNTYYAIKDHQNTVLALVDETGSIVETYTYDAYGRTKVYDASGTELPMSGTGNRYTFQGREIDWSTGLYYFRARWYNPETGRWLSKDPIGLAGGLNLYAFCGNNPVNFVDPLGLCEEVWGQQTEEAGLKQILIATLFAASDLNGEATGPSSTTPSYGNKVEIPKNVPGKSAPPPPKPKLPTMKAKVPGRMLKLLRGAGKILKSIPMPLMLDIPVQGGSYPQEA